MVLHKEIVLAQRHAAHTYEYANAAARVAATGFVPADVGKLALQLDTMALWILSDDSPVTWIGPGVSGTGGAVSSVNSETGAVTLTTDDISDSGQTNKWTTAAAITKLAGIEVLADVTDAANVDAAGATMNADTTLAGNGYFLDEDTMTSDSATKVASQQSIKAYVDAAVLAAGSYTDEQARDALGAALVAGTGVTITPDDGLNTITIASSILASSPTLYTKREMQCLVNPTGTSPTNLGFLATPLTESTNSSQPDADGPWLGHHTASTTNDWSGVNGAYTSCRRDWFPELVMRIKMGDSASILVTTVRYWMGLFSADPRASATPTAHYAAFRYDTVADGTAFWRAVTDNGSGTPTVVTTDAPVAGDLVQTLRIKLNATQALFYVDDVLKATITTTLPTSTQLLGPGLRVQTLANAQRGFRWGRIALLHV